MGHQRIISLHRALGLHVILGTHKVLSPLRVLGPHMILVLIEFWVFSGSWVLRESWVLLGYWVHIRSWVLLGSWVLFFRYADRTLQFFLATYKLCESYYIHNNTKQVCLLSINYSFAGEKISMTKAIILLSLDVCYVMARVWGK